MKPIHLLTSTLLITALLSACGGGDSSNPAPPVNNPPPPASGIGATGGTVTGTSGAKVVIPAGALATNVDIAIAQSSVGAPALPVGVVAYGQVFAFTPHGTSFATPVTISVPFDPATVPAGTTPVLYKTDATQSTFEVVAGATVSGSMMSGQVTGFSYAVVAAPKNTLVSLERGWVFAEFLADRSSLELPPDGNSSDEEVNDSRDLGPLGLVPPGEDVEARAEVYGNAKGDVYWVSTVAPHGDISKPSTPIGSEVQMVQDQTFKKTSDAATMDLVVSQSTVEMMDENPQLPTQIECPHFPSAPTTSLPSNIPSLAFDCGNLMDALVFYNVSASIDVPITDADGVVTGHSTIQLTKGTVKAHLFGYLKDLATRAFYPNWKFEVGPSADSELHFKVSPDFDVNSNVDGDPDATHARARLNRSTIIQIPLDAVKKDQEFEVHVGLGVHTNNRRQRESWIGARFRDPQKLSGVTYQLQGVEPVAVVSTGVTQPPPTEITPAPACTTGTDPSAGTLQFQQALVYTPESALQGQSLIWVTRTGGSKGELTARFSTQDGTAHAGTDYTSVSTLLRFGDGEEGQRYLEVPITDNTLVDGARTVTLTLSDLRGCAVLGTPSSAVLTIMDDDEPPPAVDSFKLGGTVSGMNGSGLMLLETFSGQTLTPSGNGAFTFTQSVPGSTSYDVRVTAQPSNPAQICTVANGTGTVSTADITNIAVTCTTPVNGGSLDSSFGSGGRVTNSLLGSAKSVVLQADGKSVVVGGMSLSRYNTDGSPDTTFGTAGQVTIIGNGGGFDAMEGVALQADGKIVVAGHTSTAPSQVEDVSVQRFNANGTLDTTFGNGGKVLTDFTGGQDAANALAVQADGKIVVAGITVTVSGANADEDIAVVRYLADGSLDASFGTGGKVSTNVAGKTDIGYGLALQADGKIVIAGRGGASGGVDPDFILVRYLANGQLDPGFNGNGKLQIAFAPNVWDEAEDVVVQADGKILAGGYAGSQYALLRLNADGTPDMGFGSNGRFSTGLTTRDNFGRALALQADGKIVLAGLVSSEANGDFGVLRVLSNGTLDNSFGTAGLVSVDFFGDLDNARDVAIQADGNILVVGYAKNGPVGLAMARIAP